MVQERFSASAKEDSGKNLSRYSNRNVAIRSLVTKDRNWRIVAKIATKTFYLVSSSATLLTIMLLVVVFAVAMHLTQKNS